MDPDFASFGASPTPPAPDLSWPCFFLLAINRNAFQPGPLLAQADPLRPRLRLSLRGQVYARGHLSYACHRHLATSEAADEAEHGRPLRPGVHRPPARGPTAPP